MSPFIVAARRSRVSPVPVQATGRRDAVNQISYTKGVYAKRSILIVEEEGGISFPAGEFVDASAGPGEELRINTRTNTDDGVRVGPSSLSRSI